MSYVGERPWWPIQSPNNVREKKSLRGERDQIKFIDLRFEIWQVVRFRKARKEVKSSDSIVENSDQLLSSLHYSPQMYARYAVVTGWRDGHRWRALGERHESGTRLMTFQTVDV